MDGKIFLSFNVPDNNFWIMFIETPSLHPINRFHLASNEQFWLQDFDVRCYFFELSFPLKFKHGRKSSFSHLSFKFQLFKTPYSWATHLNVFILGLRLLFMSHCQDIFWEFPCKYIFWTSFCSLIPALFLHLFSLQNQCFLCYLSINTSFYPFNNIFLQSFFMSIQTISFWLFSIFAVIHIFSPSSLL